MGTTAVNLLPYPDPTATPDVPRDLKALADQAELRLNLKGPVPYDSGWIRNDAHVVDNTSWRCDFVTYRCVNKVVDFAVQVTLTSVAGLNSSTSGNISNQLVGTFRPLGAAITPLWAPFHSAGLVMNGAGMVVGANIDPTGAIFIDATMPNFNLPTGSVWTLQGTWLTTT